MRDMKSIVELGGGSIIEIVVAISICIILTIGAFLILAKYDYLHNRGLIKSDTDFFTIVAGLILDPELPDVNKYILWSILFVAGVVGIKCLWSFLNNTGNV